MKRCELGGHDVPVLWKSKPAACKNCWARYGKKVKKEQKSLTVYFASQTMVMPSICENCDAFLDRTAIWGVRTYCAHIVPKAYFPSVACHPQNKVFLCIQCHTNLDNWGSDKVRQMRIYPTLVERFNLFRDQITEKRKLPGYLQ